MIHTFTEENFDAEVIASDCPVLVIYSSMQNALCQQMPHMLGYLDYQFSGTVKIGILDVDAHQNLAERHEIKLVPSFRMYKSGKVIGDLAGGQPESILKAMINSAFIA